MSPQNTRPFDCVSKGTFQTAYTKKRNQRMEISKSETKAQSHVEIRKSIFDQKIYESITLENGLQVLLVSDPATPKVSAALNIRIGHFWNDKIDGLAHFVEHMLFLGTKTFPEESSYHKFVSSHGGHTNAMTSSEDTTYYFDITPEHFEEALHRFSSFFVCPLFTESATDREINAVHSEFVNGKSQDEWRLGFFNQFIANPDHPYHHFHSGNNESLRDNASKQGINIRSAAIEFWEKYYSSNLMKLVLFGKQSIDELAKYAKSYFSEIKNKNVDTRHSKFGTPVFAPEQLPSYYVVIPSAEVLNLRLYWPLPSYKTNWREKPDHYVSHLLGHEANGSLFAYFKKQGWALQLVAGTVMSMDEFSFFTVTVALTQEGESHINEMIHFVAEYLDMLRANGVQKWIFDEQRLIAEAQFKYQEKSKPASQAIQLSAQMQMFPVEHLLDGPYSFINFDEKLIHSVLDHLVPKNMIVQLISNTQKGRTVSTTPIYEVEFTKLPVTDLEIFKQHKNTPPLTKNTELYLPAPNPFIPTDFSIKVETEPQENVPQIIKQSELCMVFHKFDTTFNRPKAHAMFQIFLPICYASPQLSVLTNLFMKLCEDSLNEEYTYFAELAGLSFAIEMNMDGILLEVAGFNQKLDILAKKIFERLKTIELQNDRFQVQREQLIRHYKNLQEKTPYEAAPQIMRELMSQSYWNLDQKLEALNQITFEQLRTFVSTFLLTNMKIHCLIQGNLTMTESLAIFDDLEAIFNPLPIAATQLYERRLVKLPKGFPYKYRSKPTKSDETNSLLWLEIQIGLRTLEIDCLVSLLALIIEEPFFAQLRTREQLGYAVWALQKFEIHTASFLFVIQSPNHDPDFLLGRVEDFLLGFYQALSDLPEDQFGQFLQAFIENQMEKPHKLGAEVKQNWVEILNRSYFFNRKTEMATYSKIIRKSDLVDFYRKFFLDANSRRSICVQLFGAPFAAQVHHSDTHPTPPLPASGTQTPSRNVIVAHNGRHVIYKGQERAFKDSLNYWSTVDLAPPKEINRNEFSWKNLLKRREKIQKRVSFDDERKSLPVVSKSNNNNNSTQHQQQHQSNLENSEEELENLNGNEQQQQNEEEKDNLYLYLGGVFGVSALLFGSVLVYYSTRRK